MKALIITSRYPYSYFGGDSERTKNLVKYFSYQNFNVDLLAFTEENLLSIEDNKNINNQFLIYNKVSFKELSYIFFSIFLGKPIQCSYYINKKTKSLLKNFDFDKYDKIIVFLTRLAPILDFVKDEKKIIFDMADILTINYKNAWKSPGLELKWKLIYTIEYFLIRNKEKFLLKKEFPKLLVSKRDYDFAINNLDGCESNLYFLPNHIKHFNTRKILEKAKEKINRRKINDEFKICFIGNMKAQHNHSAILSIIKSKIIPKLQNKNINLTIIGNMNKMQAYFYQKNDIKVIINPKNLYDASSNFDCGISLLKHCSGLQNKLYDYANLGIPIIASEDSANGIGFKNNIHFLLSNTYSEFYDKALILKRNKDLSFNLVSNCINFIQENYSLESVEKRFSKILFN